MTPSIQAWHVHTDSARWRPLTSTAVSSGAASSDTAIRDTAIRDAVKRDVKRTSVNSPSREFRGSKLGGFHAL